jgi:hypothetical protein
MTRNSPNIFWSSQQDNAPFQVFGDNGVASQWGTQITFGRRFDCDQWAIEGTYWTLGDSSRTTCFDGSTNPLDANMTTWPVILQGTSAVNANGTPSGNPTHAQEWFNDSPLHVITRTDEIHDLELNFLRTRICGCGCGGGCGCSGCGGGCGCGGNGGGCGGCGGFNIDLLAGIRYFHFNDHLIWSAEHGAVQVDDAGNPVAGTSCYQGGWITLDDQVSNDLLGGQIGFNVEYCFAPQWKVFARPEVGLYNDHMNMQWNLGAVGPDGTNYPAKSQTFPTCGYPVNVTDNGFSVLSQLDVGLDWQVTCHIGAQVGYRLIAISGIGLADNQVSTCLDETPAISHIQKNGDLILQGIFAGLTFDF